MRVEIINTGSELLLGTTLNSHGAWLGQELFKQGLRVAFQCTVPDGEAIREAAAGSIERSEILFITGGLGPTSDDLTREMLAEVLDRALITDEHAMRTIEAFFRQRGYEMSEENKKQAQLPVGCEIMPNPHGTAPGIYVPPRLAKGCAVFVLPGPPRELEPMFHHEVAPRVRGLRREGQPPLCREWKFTGIGESHFHQGVDQSLEAIADLEYGFCARPGELDCRLIGSEQAVKEGEKVLEETFGDYCFSREGESLARVVIDLFEEEGHTLAIAESCTGGLIASRLTDEPGASAAFDQSVVTYSRESKTALLGVPAELISQHGAVSAEVAAAMAEGALDLSHDDFALAVTGIAGPTTGGENYPVGTVFLALAQYDHPTHVIRRHHLRSRAVFKWVVSQDALEMVRRRMIGLTDLQDRF